METETETRTQHYAETRGDSVRGFEGLCPCGWIGRTWPRGDYALADAEEHVLALALVD